MTKVLDEIIKSKMCAGCGLCAGLNQNIEMKYDKEGYLRPFIDQSISKQEEETIEKVCPALKLDYKILKEETINSDLVWGNYNDLSLAYSNDLEIRHKASSGGVISSLLIYLLDKKIVDGVIHVGVDKERPLDNRVYLSTTKKEVLENSGSRYSPSSPLLNIDEFLNQDKKFVFVGKPCDVAALAMLSKIDKRVNEKILYKISFFCAGVPSIKGTEKILARFNAKAEDVESFRYRGDGWPGFTKIELKDQSKHQLTYEESWGTVLNKYLQPRCKVCIDGIGEFADICCGDGWIDNKNGYPDFSEAEGRSLVITRNQKGADLLKIATADKYIVLEEELEKNKLELIQPYQAKRRALLLSRILALKTFNKKTPQYPSRLLLGGAKKVKLTSNIKSYLGTIKRVAQGRI